MEKMRGDGYKLLLERFQLDTRGTLFTIRTFIHWNNLSRQVVDSSVLDTLQDSAEQGAGPPCLEVLLPRDVRLDDP